MIESGKLVMAAGGKYISYEGDIPSVLPRTKNVTREERRYSSWKRKKLEQQHNAALKKEDEHESALNKTKNRYRKSKTKQQQQYDLAVKKADDDNAATLKTDAFSDNCFAGAFNPQWTTVRLT